MANGSALACVAVRGHPPTEPRTANGGPADPTGLPCAAIDEIVELEISGLTCTVHIVAQRAAALGDRSSQRLADGRHEPLEAGAGDAVRRPGRANADAEQ